MAINTGQGATITFGGSAVVANITSIKGVEASREVINKTTLATTSDEETMQGDLTKWSEFDVEFNWDDEAGPPTIGATAASVVITSPLGGLTTAANLTGTGFYTKIKYPDFDTDALQTGSCTIKFDGVTGPTFTAGS